MRDIRTFPIYLKMISFRGTYGKQTVSTFCISVYFDANGWRKSLQSTDDLEITT